MDRVIHFEIQADDVKRAQKFYEKVFGWKIERMMSKENGGMDYWGITTRESGPGINGGIYERPKKKEDINYYYDCTVEVKDIDTSMKMIKENGGKIIKEKMESEKVGWFASAIDPEGNHVGLMQATEWVAK